MAAGSVRALAASERGRLGWRHPVSTGKHMGIAIWIIIIRVIAALLKYLLTNNGDK